MGKNSEISWTDHTFNPWWGCVKVSDGCQFCYAETFDKRVGGHHWGPSKTTERRLFGEAHWREPLKWNREAEAAGERRRVFCASMADVFEDNLNVHDERIKLWTLIDQTPWLDWLLLTKRPENLQQPFFLPWAEHGRFWPNVWLGTSVESQEYAEQRIPHLLKVPAAVRFLSCEPLLGPVDLGPWLPYYTVHPQRSVMDVQTRDALEDLFRAAVRHMGGGIDWVIVGGESGPRHRPFDLDWARLLRDQCVGNEIAYHFKQIGGLHHAAGGRLLDGREWSEFPTPRRLEVPVS